ncbi:MAG TPA: restriction endonuclease subunit S, partial [Bacteroides uniformis]|nr:restriction endonuclease subunit S [Bacteroides uniformis]
MTTMAIDNKDKKVLNVPHLRFPEFTEEWVNVSLKDVADFQKERISSGLLDESTYISTENILQNFQGVQSAISIPANTNVVAYKKNDILLSNIRPYLKKVWFSDRIGGCSADVFVLRSKTCEPEFLYNVIASDKFINYVMSGAKGVKMPRGDKNQMESFSFSIPAVVEQRKISRLFQLLDERIVTQNKVIEDFRKLKSAIRKKMFSFLKDEYT